MCLSLAYVCPVQAQEGQPGKGQPDIDATIVKSEPDPGPGESESKTNKLPVPTSNVKEVARDSVQLKLAKPFNKPADKVEKEEDPLSFNFLYYIIEKFKLSDIIE
jgi:hypothetical protein